MARKGGGGRATWNRATSADTLRKRTVRCATAPGASLPKCTWPGASCSCLAPLPAALIRLAELVLLSLSASASFCAAGRMEVGWRLGGNGMHLLAWQSWRLHQPRIGTSQHTSTSGRPLPGAPGGTSR
jgi:hypothetical protein